MFTNYKSIHWDGPELNFRRPPPWGSRTEGVVRGRTHLPLQPIPRTPPYPWQKEKDLTHAKNFQNLPDCQAEDDEGRQMEETPICSILPSICRRDETAVRRLGVARRLPCPVHRANAEVLVQTQTPADGFNPPPTETGPGQLHQEFRLSPRRRLLDLEDQCRENLGRGRCNHH